MLPQRPTWSRLMYSSVQHRVSKCKGVGAPETEQCFWQQCYFSIGGSLSFNPQVKIPRRATTMHKGFGRDNVSGHLSALKSWRQFCRLETNMKDKKNCHSGSPQGLALWTLSAKPSLNQASVLQMRSSF